MEMIEFINRTKEAKTDTKQTGFYGVKVLSNHERTIQTIYRINICKTCKVETRQGIQIIFKEPWKLTIFEAEMLFAIFFLKKKPYDYAVYHKCIAGKKFIDNILEIK